MAKLSIPPPHLPGFKIINLLSTDETNILYDVLRKLPKGVSYKDFLTLLSEKLKLDDIEELSKAVFSLSSVLSKKEFNIDVIGTHIADSYLEQHNSDELTNFNRETFEEKVKFILLNSSAISLTYQAFELLNNSNKNLVRKFEINADVNLIVDEEGQTKNGLIFHNLKIDFEINSKDRVQQFLLDKRDLQRLKAEIETALLTEENIKKNNQGIINFLDITES